MEAGGVGERMKATGLEGQPQVMDKTGYKTVTDSESGGHEDNCNFI